MIDWLKSSLKEKYRKQPHNKKITSSFLCFILKGNHAHSGAQSWVIKFSTGQTPVLFWHAAVEIHSNI